MSLRSYKNLHIFRNKLNELLKLNFPGQEVKEIDPEYNGEVMEAAKVIFTSGGLEGITAGVHNYKMHIDIPEEKLKANPYFEKHFNFWFSEVHAWVKSEGKRIRIYPRDRNEYLDNETDLIRRAYYFVIVLQVALGWVKENINPNNE